MAPFRRLAVVPSRATLLIALLLLTMVLAGLLAYEAHLAARSHRVTLERAARDYAAFAARELLANTMDALHLTLTDALGPVTSPKATSPYEPLPSPELFAAAAERALRCADPAADSARFYFRHDLRAGDLVTTGAAPAPLISAWVARAVAAHARSSYRPDQRYAVLFGEGAAADRAVVYGVRYAEHGAPVAAYGFVTCASTFGQPLFRHVPGRRLLIPYSAAGESVADSLLSITVLDATGREVYRSPSQAGSTLAETVISERFGGLTMRAALSPAAVGRLLIGRPPRSRLPLLVGLLVLTAGLAAVALVQLRREHELAQMRADFTASVSHELRTPLAQILLYGETLSLGRVRSEAERSVAADTIVQEARRLMHMVENTLHFARAERRANRLHPEPTSVASLVRAVTMAFTPLAEAAGVRLRVVLEEDLVAVVDTGAFRQLLLNLLDNAVRYGPPGQVVTVGAARMDDRARIWVDDEGPGIPTQDRERIWIPFVRGTRGGDAARSGSGLGLAVVRELTRLHGGDAWVEASPRGGARFVVALPSAEEPRCGIHAGATA